YAAMHDAYQSLLYILYFQSSSIFLLFFFLMIRPPPTSTLFPYTTLFRSFPAQAGSSTSYIGANFNNTTGTNTISNWLLTPPVTLDRKSTRLNSSHVEISYAVFCLKKKKKNKRQK